MTAVLTGDAPKLAELTAERNALPAQSFAAEVEQLRAEMVELRKEVAKGKVSVEHCGAIVRSLRDKRCALDQQIALTERDSDLAVNQYEGAKHELIQRQLRLEDIALAQQELAKKLAGEERRGYRPRP